MQTFKRFNKYFFLLNQYGYMSIIKFSVVDINKSIRYAAIKESGEVVRRKHGT